MNRKIKAGIAGGAGYTAGELIAILHNHPDVEISFVHSKSNAGKSLSQVHRHLAGETDRWFSSEISHDIDVLFLCVGHGESRAFLQKNDIPEHIVVIDLSQDFRLKDANEVNERKFVYGLPEANREEIRKARNIANPGCFATAIQLALLPFASIGLLNEVHATGITGATGAGQKPQSSSHFSWRSSNVQSYKALSHQHVKEIAQTLGNKQPGFTALNFVPWRGCFTRGIYISAYMYTSLSLDDAYSLYHAFYDTHPFTHVLREGMDMKQAVNTNKCLLHLEKENDKIIVHAAIDNLLKGASGQAVQNMNLVFGFPEDAGLKLKAISF